MPVRGTIPRARTLYARDHRSVAIEHFAAFGSPYYLVESTTESSLPQLRISRAIDSSQLEAERIESSRCIASFKRLLIG